MDERRRWRRYEGKLLIATIYHDDSGKIVTEESLFSHDISTGGLRLSLPFPLPTGKVLDLKVYVFSDPVPAPVQGKVTWFNKKEGSEADLSGKKTESRKAKELYWAGVQFVNIDMFTRGRILRWIKKEFGVEEL